MRVEGLTKRLKALDQAIRDKEAVKAEHSPFVFFQPWEMLADQYNVCFYPEGKYQRPIKHERITYSDALNVLRLYPGDLRCHLSMGACTEWLFAILLKDGRLDYSDEQIERLTKEYSCKHPELNTLLSTDEGRKMLDTLAELPQVATIQLGVLLDALLIRLIFHSQHPLL